MLSSSSQTQSSNRATFLLRTYGHLFAAMMLFVLVEVFLFRSGLAETIASALLGVNWLLVLGGFMVVSWFASRAAHRAKSYTTQYLALVAFVLAEALLFVPLLFVAQSYAPGVIQNAGFVTLIGFAGLTAVAWTERLDFSFLGSLLKWGGIVAIVLIVAAVLFGFHLGVWISVAVVSFAGAAILYDTSKVLHHYPDDRYVAAALELFASVALLFWYVLRLFMAGRE